MGKKLPTTPRSRVKNALRNLWLRSRERAAALKRDGYSCVKCGKKQFVKRKNGKIIEQQKIQVHHRQGVCNWEKIIDCVFEELLCSPEFMESVCPECHGEEEGKGHFKPKVKIELKRRAK